MARIELTSTITDVTVYRDRAVVKRCAVAALDTTAGEILIGGLPAALDEYTFRAGGRGTAVVKIAGVELQREYRGEPLDAERRELRDALTAARDRRQVLQNRKKLTGDRIAFLEKTAKLGCDDLSKTIARKRLTIDEGRAIIDFYHDSIAELTAQLESLAVSMRGADEELASMEQRWQQIESPRLLEGKSACLSVAVDSAGDFSFEISYVIAGACWQSAYDVRFDTASKKLRLACKAAVMQNTGESWDGVALTLSTASPGSGANPPELAPRYLDVQAPFLRNRMAAPVPPPAMAAHDDDEKVYAASISDSMDIAEEDSFEAEMLAADIEASGGPSVSYRAPGKATIPPDGNPHLVLVGEEEFACAIDYVSVPELVETAYLRAKATNASPLVLLAGNTNIYRDDDFVGRGTMTLVNPGAEFTVYLGSDERLCAVCETKRVDDDSAGLTGGLRRLDRSVAIALSSDINEETRVSVMARRPVTQNRDIKIKSVKYSDRPAEEKDDGTLRWDLVLPPKGGKKLGIEYTVEYPRDRTVTGL